MNSYLVKTAKKCIEGSPLTNSNYSEALDLLKTRYGNPELVISAHKTKIMQIERITKERNATELCNLLDTVESHVRSLGSQGVNKDHVGALLIPILQERLPTEIKLQISRKMGKENWMLDKYLDCLKEEIEARDCCEIKTINMTKDKIKSENKDPYTIQTLLNTIQDLKFKNSFDQNSKSKRFCVFCDMDHYSDQCTVVTDLNKRFEIIRFKKACFKCLRQGHLRTNCRGKSKCFKCKSESHHTATCNFKQQDRRNSTSLVVTENSSELLQTAQGVVADVKKSR